MWGGFWLSSRKDFAAIADILIKKKAVKEFQSLEASSRVWTCQGCCRREPASRRVPSLILGALCTLGEGLFGYPEVALLPWSLLPGLDCCILSPRILEMLEMNSL